MYNKPVTKIDWLKRLIKKYSINQNKLKEIEEFNNSNNWKEITKGIKILNDIYYGSFEESELAVKMLDANIKLEDVEDLDNEN